MPETDPTAPPESAPPAHEGYPTVSSRLPSGIPVIERRAAPQPLPPSAAWDQGRQLGELTTRVDMVERRLNNHIADTAGEIKKLRAPLDHVVAVVDRQEQQEATKKAAAEARDAQMRAMAVHQRALNAWMLPLLGSILVAMVGLLVSRLAQDVSREAVYALLVACVIAVLGVLIWSARRARLAPPLPAPPDTTP